MVRKILKFLPSKGKAMNTGNLKIINGDYTERTETENLKHGDIPKGRIRFEYFV